MGPHTLETTLNFRADALATTAQDTWSRPQEHQPYLTEDAIHLTVDRRTVTNKLRRTLAHALYSQDLREYFEKTQDWRHQQADLIAWSVVKKKRPYISDQTRLHEYLHGSWIPTNKHLHRHNRHHNHRCPRCQAVYEDTTHVIRCPAPSVEVLRMSWQQEWTDTLRQLHMEPHLFNMLEALSTWLFSMGRLDIQQDWQSIGWELAFKGFWPSSVLQHQHNWLSTLKVTHAIHTADRWTTRLIRKRWDLFLTLWKDRCHAKHHHDAHEAQIRIQQALYPRL